MHHPHFILPLQNRGCSVSSKYAHKMNVDYDDPEELLICPYDPVHRIRIKRFPYHLVKCRKVIFLLCFGILTDEGLLTKNALCKFNHLR